MTLDYGNYGIFLIMGNAAFISSTVASCGYGKKCFLPPYPSVAHILAVIGSVEISCRVRKATVWFLVGNGGMDPYSRIVHY